MKPRDLALAALAAATIAAVAGPHYLGVGNRIEPFIFGLPLSLMWNVGWLLRNFAGLLLNHLTQPAD